MSQVIQFIACLLEINFSPYFNGEKTESKKTNHSTRRILRMVLDGPGLEADLLIAMHYSAFEASL